MASPKTTSTTLREALDASPIHVAYHPATSDSRLYVEVRRRADGLFRVCEEWSRGYVEDEMFRTLEAVEAFLARKAHAASPAGDLAAGWVAASTSRFAAELDHDHEWEWVGANALGHLPLRCRVCHLRRE